MQFALPPRRYSKRLLERSNWDLVECIHQLGLICKDFNHFGKHYKMELLNELCMGFLQIFEYLENNPKRFDLKMDNLFDIIYFTMDRFVQEIDDMKNEKTVAKVTIQLADDNVVFMRYFQSLVRGYWQKRISSIPNNKLNDDVLWVISGFSTKVKI
jgi:hypothetical protein